MASTKPWDIVILGANGYTGRFAVQHVYEHLPTNLKWAVAGRSAKKLTDLVDGMHKSHPDRKHPAIETLELTKKDLDALASKTKVLVNCVGPYHIYSTPVVEACVNNGTHYFDVNGETPWMYDIIAKYHEKAKANGAIIVPGIGLESAPTDLLGYMIASHFRKAYNIDTDHVTSCVYRLKSGGFSGGTLSTILNIMENYSVSQITTSMKPYSLSPSPPSTTPPTRRPYLSSLLGPFTFPNLGILSTSPSAIPNIAIAHRTAGLLPTVYGPHFRLEEYARFPNRIVGVLVHLSIAALGFLIFLPPFRYLAKRILTQPGFGPSDSANEGSSLDMRAVGTAIDPKTGITRKALAKFTYNQHIYLMSGVLMIEGAMTILADGGKAAEDVKRMFGGGGILTPACLDEATEGGFRDRLLKTGFGEEVRDLE